ncbi:hypothetical protein ILUMI_04178 [Ignelater luminosus]|uniref:Uncharacterized protein n=1 Tax=Ignelater luminosus TaxID=2038154 RepID=A0A8K0DEY5_IGNLU|nr:hypothetical protein ILUMI_04178 [Ignelater luminosus]
MFISTNVTKKKRKIQSLKNLSSFCHRYAISDRAAAAIASDYYKSGLQRAGQKLPLETLTEDQEEKYRLTSVEKHISILREPGSIYVAYAVPNQGTAKGLKFAIHEMLTCKQPMFLQDTVAIGCDGTVTNTGKYGGVIRLLEKRLNSGLFLPQELKKVVDLVIKRNTFFAHLENLLLFMIFDEQKNVRKLAARRISKARETRNSGPLWVLEVQKINLNALSHINLIDWQQQYSQPSILRDVSNKTFHSLVESKSNDDVPFLRLPCHTQAVERSVKTVAAVSLPLFDKKSRESLIKTKFHCQKRMSNFESKKDL